MLGRLGRLIRTVLTVARVTLDGVLLVRSWDDIKQELTPLALGIGSFAFKYEQVREFLIDRATYLFLLEQMGTYGPPGFGVIAFLLFFWRAYSRGQRAENSGAEDDASSPVPESSVHTEHDDAQVFRKLEVRMLDALNYISRRNPLTHTSHEEVDMLSLSHDLKKMGVSWVIPNSLVGVQIAALMRSGDLDEARKRFPPPQDSDDDLPF